MSGKILFYLACILFVTTFVVASPKPKSPIPETGAGAPGSAGAMAAGGAGAGGNAEDQYQYDDAAENAAAADSGAGAGAGAGGAGAGTRRGQMAGGQSNIPGALKTLGATRRGNAHGHGVTNKDLHAAAKVIAAVRRQMDYDNDVDN